MNLDGRLHIIRPGMVVTSLAELQQEGICGVWAVKVAMICNDDTHSLQPNDTALVHSGLVYSFMNETRVMNIGDEMQEVLVINLSHLLTVSDCITWT